MHGSFSRVAILLALLCSLLLFTQTAPCYSVLTHEELIDLAWKDSIRPLLLARFPQATEAQLREAHAYAYGGSAIQDMGYYPFGKPLFSDLTHYARTGDFINCLFQNARTIDELAFAIGALSHYLGDNIGHSRAINPATAIAFPKLERKFGPSVTYDQSPHSHIRTEFAFDIGQLTDRAFAPPPYLQYIGLRVPRKFLERAFRDTYGLDTHEILGRTHAALRSYRTSVRSFIPAFAEAEVVLHHNRFPPNPNDQAYKIFSERVSRTNYDRHWSHRYSGPGVKAHLLAVLVFIIPKVGAASDLAIKIPTPETEEWYLTSMNQTVDSYHEILTKLKTSADHPLALENLDLDTGKLTTPGTYPLTDATYAKLLERLTSRPGRTVSRELKQNIENFYADPNAPITTKKDKQAWERVIAQLKVLGQMKVAPDSR
jgi:hypothetical protein